MQRRVQLAGTQTRDGLESAVRYSVELRFVEHTVRVENGRARETGFRILKAHETRQGETVEVAAPGTEYVLMTGPSVYQMKDPATGQAFQNQELHRVMGGNLPFELWPGKPLTQGLAWAFRGQDLARRLAPLGVLDGRINLRVASIGPEPNTGLQTARIIGRFNGQVESGSGISMDYIARVEIHLPLRLGIPFHFEFTGPVSYSVQTQSDGRQQNTIFNGQYDFVQSSSPSRTVLAALDAADAAATAAAADSDVDRRDEEGATPLMMAALNGDTELIRDLLARGANIDLQDPNGYSALMYAGIGYELEAMRMLLEVGANPNLRANEGVAGIVNLSSNRDQSGTKGAFVVQAVTLLLDGGADPNARYTDGMTPLMYAALNNNYGLAELLVQRGADLGLKNKDGLTARDIAGGFGHTQVAVLLSKTPGRP